MRDEKPESVSPALVSYSIPNHSSFEFHAFTSSRTSPPAGGWECLKAAVANGAAAVFFGLPRFNARLRADNFTEDEVSEVVGFCHRHGVKAYVTMNTLALHRGIG